MDFHGRRPQLRAMRSTRTVTWRQYPAKKINEKAGTTGSCRTTSEIENIKCLITGRIVPHEQNTGDDRTEDLLKLEAGLVNDTCVVQNMALVRSLEDGNLSRSRGSHRAKRVNKTSTSSIITSITMTSPIKDDYVLRSGKWPR